MSAMNAARESLPRAMSASRASHAPVSSGEARLATGSAWIRPMPNGVATRCCLVRSTKPRRNSVSMIAARVAGVPSPRSFIAARRVSSSICLPAASIAPSSVASL